LADRLSQEYPETNGDWGSYMLPPRDVTAQQFNINGLLIMLPAGFVLLIACANVSHLQLARALERRKEVALRTALGAGRFKIARQLLIESVLVALIVGLLGLGVAYAGVSALMNALTPQATQAIGGLKLDQEALTFMIVISSLSGIVFGLAPAWQASRVDMSSTLKEGSTRASTGK
jgi:putative ABC transport system permease protein